MSREDRIAVALYAANRRMAVELVLWLLALPGAPTEEAR